MKHRPLIDIFSPLPPLPTDIANHTAALLPALSRGARVRVWTSQPGPIGLDVPEVRVCRFDPLRLPSAALNEADATFFNLGNNAAFHRDIHLVARRVPGTVILHDTRLQHFFAAYSEQEGADRDYYLGSLHRAHGADARRMGQAFIDGTRPLQDLVDAAPMTLAAFDGAIAAVLHNREEQEALALRTHVPVYHLPLSFRFGPAPRRMPRGPGEPTRLVMFGFIGENRRLLAILDALAGMADRALYRLDIYGLVEQADQADERIAALGLGGLVTRHGFVAEPVLDAALARADLALNLRWPSMGEASGSQLRIWSAGLPALVTGVGWYAQLADDAVFKVDPDREGDEIVGHLRALRRAPARYEMAGAEGRRIVEALHAPERYAEGLLAIAAEGRGQHARHMGSHMAERCGKLMLELGPADLARPFGGELARHIAALSGGARTS